MMAWYPILCLKRLIRSLHVASSCHAQSVRAIVSQQIVGVTMTSGITTHFTARRPTKVISFVCVADLLDVACCLARGVN